MGNSQSEIYTNRIKILEDQLKNIKKKYMNKDCALIECRQKNLELKNIIKIMNAKLTELGSQSHIDSLYDLDLNKLNIKNNIISKSISESRRPSIYPNKAIETKNNNRQHLEIDGLYEYDSDSSDDYDSDSSDDYDPVQNVVDNIIKSMNDNSVNDKSINNKSIDNHVIIKNDNPQLACPLVKIEEDTISFNRDTMDTIETIIKDPLLIPANTLIEKIEDGIQQQIKSPKNIKKIKSELNLNSNDDKKDKWSESGSFIIRDKHHKKFKIEYYRKITSIQYKFE